MRLDTISTFCPTVVEKIEFEVEKYFGCSASRLAFIAETIPLFGAFYFLVLLPSYFPENSGPCF